MMTPVGAINHASRSANPDIPEALSTRMVRPSNLLKVRNEYVNTGEWSVLDIVHGSDSGIGIGILLVTNETETTATARITILDYDLPGDRSVSGF
jgi:hypothetical protein